jgi:hypothetical protein
MRPTAAAAVRLDAAVKWLSVSSSWVVCLQAVIILFVITGSHALAIFGPTFLSDVDSSLLHAPITQQITPSLTRTRLCTRGRSKGPPTLHIRIVTPFTVLIDRVKVGAGAVVRHRQPGHPGAKAGGRPRVRQDRQVQGAASKILPYIYRPQLNLTGRIRSDGRKRQLS